MSGTSGSWHIPQGLWNSTWVAGCGAVLIRSPSSDASPAPSVPTSAGPHRNGTEHLEEGHPLQSAFEVEIPPTQRLPQALTLSPKQGSGAFLVISFSKRPPPGRTLLGQGPSPTAAQHPPGLGWLPVYPLGQSQPWGPGGRGGGWPFPSLSPPSARSQISPLPADSDGLVPQAGMETSPHPQSLACPPPLDCSFSGQVAGFESHLSFMFKELGRKQKL